MRLLLRSSITRIIQIWWQQKSLFLIASLKGTAAKELLNKKRGNDDQSFSLFLFFRIIFSHDSRSGCRPSCADHLHSVISMTVKIALNEESSVLQAYTPNRIVSFAFHIWQIRICLLLHHHENIQCNSHLPCGWIYTTWTWSMHRFPLSPNQNTPDLWQRFPSAGTVHLHTQ